jgi:hypothetical protein
LSRACGGKALAADFLGRVKLAIRRAVEDGGKQAFRFGFNGLVKPACKLGLNCFLRSVVEDENDEGESRLM